MAKSKNRRNHAKKVAHRKMMQQHEAAKQKKAMDQVMAIQKMLQENPGLLSQVQSEAGPQPSGGFSTMLPGS
jgi:hypothetical protein